MNNSKADPFKINQYNNNEVIVNECEGLNTIFN